MLDLDLLLRLFRFIAYSMPRMNKLIGISADDICDICPNIQIMRVRINLQSLSRDLLWILFEFLDLPSITRLLCSCKSLFHHFPLFVKSKTFSRFRYEHSQVIVEHPYKSIFLIVGHSYKSIFLMMILMEFLELTWSGTKPD